MCRDFASSAPRAPPVRVSPLLFSAFDVGQGARAQTQRSSHEHGSNKGRDSGQAVHNVPSTTPSTTAAAQAPRQAPHPRVLPPTLTTAVAPSQKQQQQVCKQQPLFAQLQPRPHVPTSNPFPFFYTQPKGVSTTATTSTTTTTHQSHSGDALADELNRRLRIVALDTAPSFPTSPGDVVIVPAQKMRGHVPHAPKPPCAASGKVPPLTGDDDGESDDGNTTTASVTPPSLSPCTTSPASSKSLSLATSLASSRYPSAHSTPPPTPPPTPPLLELPAPTLRLYGEGASSRAVVGQATLPLVPRDLSQPEARPKTLITPVVEMDALYPATCPQQAPSMCDEPCEDTPMARKRRRRGGRRGHTALAMNRIDRSTRELAAEMACSVLGPDARIPKPSQQTSAEICRLVSPPMVPELEQEHATRKQGDSGGAGLGKPAVAKQEQANHQQNQWPSASLVEAAAATFKPFPTPSLIVVPSSRSRYMVPPAH